MLYIRAIFLLSVTLVPILMDASFQQNHLWLLQLIWCVGCMVAMHLVSQWRKMDDRQRHTLCHTTVSKDKRLVRQQEGIFHYMRPDVASSGDWGPELGLRLSLCFSFYGSIFLSPNWVTYLWWMSVESVFAQVVLCFLKVLDWLSVMDMCFECVCVREREGKKRFFQTLLN